MFTDEYLEDSFGRTADYQFYRRPWLDMWDYQDPHAGYEDPEYDEYGDDIEGYDRWHDEDPFHAYDP